MSTLSRAGFIISHPSTLKPVERIFSPGKRVDLVDRFIQSHMLQMFNIWCCLATINGPSSRLLAEALSFVNWHVRLRLGGGPLLAGNYCCDIWGVGGFENPTLVRVLEGLATAIVHCMHHWHPPPFAPKMFYSDAAQESTMMCSCL